MGIVKGKSINVQMQFVRDGLICLKMEHSDPLVVQKDLSAALIEFTKMEYSIVNVGQFYNRHTEKHVATIFYYE